MIQLALSMGLPVALCERGDPVDVAGQLAALREELGSAVVADLPAWFASGGTTRSWPTASTSGVASYCYGMTTTGRRPGPETSCDIPP